jgi:hypothetical protein
MFSCIQLKHFRSAAASAMVSSSVRAQKVQSLAREELEVRATGGRNGEITDTSETEIESRSSLEVHHVAAESIYFKTSGLLANLVAEFHWIRLGHAVGDDMSIA